MPSKVQRLILAALLAAAPIWAQVVEFKDVVLLYSKKPGDKPKDKDGVLYLDRTSGVISFAKEGKKQPVLTSIVAKEITGITYFTKGKHRLKIDFNTAAGRKDFAQMYLKGGNRDKIVLAIEDLTGLRAARVNEK
jgi:hypothetical protein